MRIVNAVGALHQYLFGTGTTEQVIQLEKQLLFVKDIQQREAGMTADSSQQQTQ